VLGRLFALAESLDIAVRGLIRSPLTGPAGNVEFLIWLGPGAPVEQEPAIQAAVAARA
jgi:23S rRNA (cytidine1920-2'-O)/16S rRNA (cytidine1409-2'-O)-methyltransferase